MPKATIEGMLADIPIIGDKDLTEKKGFIEVGNLEYLKKLYDPADIKDWVLYIKAVCGKLGLQYIVNKDWC